MKYTGVEANVVALAGIAIAIGTMVDLAIIVTENIVQHLERQPEDAEPLDAIRTGAAEVAPAVLTAVAVTIISILPVFFLGGQEGRMFGPLAYTMTFALAGSVVVALAAIPPLAYVLMGIRVRRSYLQRALEASTIPLGVAAAVLFSWWIGGLIVLVTTIPIEIETIGQGLSATAVSLIYSVGQAGGFIGLVLVGALEDVTGTLHTCFVVLVVAALGIIAAGSAMTSLE
jgi:Cu(I)/Ag(I) efflux system membrane protein CusA/SilA